MNISDVSGVKPRGVRGGKAVGNGIVGESVGDRVGDNAADVNTDVGIIG